MGLFHVFEVAQWYQITQSVSSPKVLKNFEIKRFRSFGDVTGEKLIVGSFQFTPILNKVNNLSIETSVAHKHKWLTLDKQSLPFANNISKKIKGILM